jgi:hypothetical protein
MPWSPLYFYVEARGRIQRKTWCVGPYAGVEYNLTYVHSRVVSITFTMDNLYPMPDSTLTLCQSRLYPPIRDFAFSLRGHTYAVFLDDVPGASQEAKEVQ